MSVHEILNEIRSLGGRIEARGDRLYLDVPEGAITPELKERLREHKVEILRQLDVEASLQSQGAGLERRLLDCGISIAIDRATGTALLIFHEVSGYATQGVAAVCDPFEVELIDNQGSELFAGLKYYDELERWKQERRK